MKTVSRWLFAGALLALFSVTVPSPASAAVPLGQTGMKPFDDWAPDKTGTQPVTTKLQQAVDWCRANDVTLYIAPGTYLVDGTITIKGADGGSNDDGHSYIHGDAYDRPVIKLQNGTFTGTPSPQNAAPVFSLIHEAGKNSSWIYFSVLSNLDFDLGNNPGACALAYAAAQDSQLTNIRITGSAFTAGIVGFPGRNTTNVNLEVIGGRYGLVMRESVGINLTGVKCTNQSVAAVLVENYRGSTIVGLETSGPGPAIVCSGTEYEAGQLYLEDARIEITNSGNAAINMGNRNLVLRNVYVKGTNQVVTGTQFGLTVSAGTNWTHVKTYASASSPTNSRTAFNYFNGTKYINNEEEDFAYVATAPADLRTRHLPDEVFAFNHPEATNALNAAGSTTRAKIQAALDGPSRVVYVPAGYHGIDGSITVPLGKVLIGDPGKRTFLNPTYTPTAQTFVVQTAAGTGSAVIQDLFIGTRDLNFDCGIHWRASSGFMLNVRNFPGHSHNERNTQAYQFTGSAGGKFYGIADHRNLLLNINPASTNFRKVLISGTSNPITFYGLNLERGGEQRNRTQSPFCEIKNSSNVRIFGSKTEPDQGEVFRIENSANIALTSIFTHRITPNPLVVLANGAGTFDDLEIAMVGTNTTSGTVNMITPYTDIKKQDLVILFRKGTFNPGAFAPGTANQPPTVSLTAPTAGSYPAYPGLVLTATAADSDGTVAVVGFDANGPAGLVDLGTDSSSPFQAPTLLLPTATGNYSLTAEATDNDLATTVSSPVVITITNSVPSITTTSLPNASVGAAYNQALAASGGDGPRTWSVSTGTLPSGLSLSGSGTISGTPSTAGTSNFTVRVVDADAIAASDDDTQALTVVVNASASTVTLNPVADSGVYQDQPTLNGGTGTFMQVNGATNYNKEGFVKFTVSGVSGTITSAKLQLTVVALPGGTPSSNAVVWSNNTTTWTETGITWNNKPASSTLRDTKAHPTAVGGVIEFDVTAAVVGNGTYSFQIKGSGSPRVDYGTRENATAANRPKLVLTVQ